MKKRTALFGKILLLITSVFLFSTCEELEGLLDAPTPTKQLMEGVWEVTEAYDENDTSIIDKVNFLGTPTYIHMDDANSVNSTAGPMFMYLVYGDSKFSQITSKLDQAFKYADLQFTEGEFFLKSGEVVGLFTIEIKMKFPGMETLNEILELMGITPPAITEAVIYHKFIDVSVSFEGLNNETMIWELTDLTTPIYNVKDEYGTYQLWEGVPVNNFLRSKYVFEKKVKTLIELVDEANTTK